MPHPAVPRTLAVCLAMALTIPASRALADDDDSSPVDWGVGVQAHRGHVSRGLQKLFVDDSPGGATQDGGGITFTRRGKQLELVIGLGFDPLDGVDGYYLKKSGTATTAGDVDYMEFHQLQWFTADFTVVGRLSLHKILALRYGAGLGFGVVRGEARKTDAICTSDRLQQDCMIDPNAVDVDVPADIPPVLPVVNLLVGAELRPFRFLSVYVDAGLHSVPYVGAGVTLYLWKGH
ncbi:MAG: hypothetical protein H6709_08820 [Kofleriaceae bacterium]|nr:hypothetical protein [Myxococcales bacterium]MCB9565177.1 hypothetical protein [Kofleriaceae bacterium]MCB9572172.1 hypothetical protein [Kofleriaceae bacterium]